MTPTARMQQIMERLAKATTGPWKQGEVVDDLGSPYEGLAETDYRAYVECDEYTIVRPGIRNEHDRDDAALIANAPADLEYLLKRCERLEAALLTAKQRHASKACCPEQKIGACDPEICVGCVCGATAHNAAIDAALLGEP